MWRTPHGERVLAGPEADAFRLGLCELVEDLAEWGDEHECGVGAFDGLSYGQRLAVLDDIARALLDPTVPTPAPTASNEAAVGAVYRQLLTLVEFELDGATCSEVRSTIRAACRERGLAVLAETNEDLQAWSDAVDGLADQILWDRDFEDGAMFLDAPPDPVTSGSLGINGDYFASAPRELRDREIVPTIKRLRSIRA